jgi:uncharacterized membrane protein YccC
MPLSILLAGLTLFVVLDGRDSFPLLCIGLAPVVIGTALMASSSNQKWASVGFLTLVFTLVVMGPSNPQDYDPESYLITALLLMISVFAVLITVTALFPTEDSDRRRWVFQSATTALEKALNGSATKGEVEQRFMDASRVAALSSLTDKPEEERGADTARLLLIVDLRFAVQRVWNALAQLGHNTGHSAAVSVETAVREGLSAADGGTLRQAALHLNAVGSPLSHDAAADIAMLACLIDLIPSMNE